MVRGIKIFREYFAGHTDQYVVIGGAACDLLFDAAGLPFRATKDIDMVLCVEVVDAAFGERFSAFLKDGGYQARERSEGKKEFYRFHKPTNEDFPFMIELFSRKPGMLYLPKEVQITPIAVDDDLLSLSAILLDDDYYEALQSAKRMIDGVPVADETLLIPFKAHAFLDLTDRKSKGEKIDEKNIRKHRNDVFRLLRLLPGNAKVEVTERIRDDLRRFADVIARDETLDPKSFDVPMSRKEAVEFLRSVYNISSS
jgi:hypothetical protein